MSDKPSYWGKIFSITESPNTLRRKLQDIWRKLGPFYDQLQALEAYVKGLPAYGGVWRTDQGTPLAVPVTTAWSVIPGFTEVRPSIPKKVNVDYTVGTVEITETGVYEFGTSLVIEGPIGRIIGLGIRTNGVDPAAAAIEAEIVATNREILITYVTTLTFVTVPTVFELVWLVDNNATLDFKIGGWSIARIDYNNPAMVDQKIM